MITQRFLLLSLLLGSLVLISNKVNEKVPEPYMDEIFHIPQAMKYVQNKFSEWDDKITTLPGLYLFSYLIEHVGMNVGFFKEFMGTSGSFRSINGLFLVALFLLFGKILHNDLRAFRLVLFPLLYFFAFLYYTDVGSCLFVCMSFYFSRKEQITTSGICALIAVLFRQSNIIWAFWIVVSYLVEQLEKRENFEEQSLISQIWIFIKAIFANFSRILIQFWSFVLLAIIFILFVVWNGGLTVGDKSNHIAITHVSQFFYFFVFSCVMEPGLLIHRCLKWKQEVKNWKGFTLSLIILTPLCAALSYYFSYVHIFMLSDNRHYIFYLWRKFFKIHISPTIQLKYCIIYSPIYVACLLLIYSEIRKQRSLIWTIVFICCTALNLIPLPLVEFRYFIVPFLLMNLNLKHVDSSLEIKHMHTRVDIINMVWYLLINGITIYIFLYKPFTGPDGNEARFMW
ncbi:hypothetical protein FDP41_011501 [Naegleria fowleri]|uniref:Dol-P-Glc:Glc(2)Man(9)GlcNAc(2)-PP-Dol alpha-1,2-glucosyltransferase n=1 Tax=Naegleria fowleri TaxID=5763 RepID=A0A6A5C664_NAEFO|nr:uncharacterized protein FDP41_011501 [Naegleria fowleri]KAF0982571.1 hypothetical protein FDP41_011501 [Naegleria fowleri]